MAEERKLKILFSVTKDLLEVSFYQEMMKI
jgi:hypothetical protein